MVKITMIGLSAMFLCITLGSVKKEYGIAVGIITSILISFYGISRLQIISHSIRELQDFLGINGSYISILLKMIGIAYLAEFSSSMCKDAGQNAIAGQIDFAGKLTMLVISLPILQSLLETLGEFMP
ncbi:MAG: stage III sporulation protein AD [Lachnoclostridium sp.]|jgi:stage III sporulation protein AD|nr:stage III sporulation protein AD [Lachnoclostridium sp.]